MKREYAHTALPWRREGGCILAGSEDRPNLVATRYSWTVINEDGNIHNVRDDGGDMDDTISPCEADSNAVLITVAVNYHDALVAAARAVVDWIGANSGDISIGLLAHDNLAHVLAEIDAVVKVSDR